MIEFTNFNHAGEIHFSLDLTFKKSTVIKIGLILTFAAFFIIGRLWRGL